MFDKHISQGEVVLDQTFEDVDLSFPDKRVDETLQNCSFERSISLKHFEAQTGDKVKIGADSLLELLS